MELSMIFLAWRSAWIILILKITQGKRNKRRAFGIASGAFDFTIGAFDFAIGAFDFAIGAFDFAIGAFDFAQTPTLNFYTSVVERSPHGGWAKPKPPE